VTAAVPTASSPPTATSAPSPAPASGSPSALSPPPALRRRPRLHPLAVDRVERLTDDAVSIRFAVPDELAPEYAFLPGQHVSIRTSLAGDDVRRSYSICSPAGSGILEVAVKRLEGGRFSSYAHDRLSPGDVLEVLTPAGGFCVVPDPARGLHYAAIAAGSGITPILSILSSVLEAEPASRCTLLYGNRAASSVMFADRLADLKDQYLERFDLHHVLSREPSEIALHSGRLDRARLERFLATVLPPETVDEWFLCGPTAMADDAVAALAAAGVPAARVHRERFHVDEPAIAEGRGSPAERGGSGAGVGPEAPATAGEVPAGAGGSAVAATLTATLDGRTSVVELAPGETVLQGFLRVRPDAPFACQAAVCGTCRAVVREGRVSMAHNYALEPDEVAAGAVLTCQSRPETPTITVDYDA